MTRTAAEADSALRLDPELAPLVERTRGLQPFRRLFHAGNGLLLALAPSALGMSRALLLSLLGAILLLLLASDLIRLRSRRLNRLFFAAFPALASPREAHAFASSTWYVAGVLIAYAAFPLRVAVAATLVLGLADPAAGAVGRTWGTRRVGTGTLEGCAAFLLVSAAVLAGYAPLGPALAAAALTTAVEATPWPLDDNLTIPLAAGGVLWLLGA